MTISDELIELDNNLNNIPKYPELSNVDNITLWKYFFDIVESEKYDIQLSPGYPTWVESVLDECHKRNLISK